MAHVLVRSSSRFVAAAAAALTAFALATPTASASTITSPVTVSANPPAEQFVAVGATVTLSASAEDGSATSVQPEAWQVASTDAGPFADIPDTAAGTYQIASISLDSTGWYRAAFPDGAGGRVFSSPGHVIVGTAPAVTTPTGPALTPAGQAFTLATVATGSAPLTLLWQSAPSSTGPWSVVVGASSAQPQLTAASTAGVTTYYRVAASSPFGSSTSQPFAVKTYTGPDAPTAVSASNTAPNTLVVAWTGGGATGVNFSFAVELTRIESGDVVSKTASSSPTSFTGLNAGTYAVRVQVTSDAGSSAWTSAPSPVVVLGLNPKASLSSGTLRPYVDGFQDTVTISASSSFTASGVARIRNGSGAVVRSFTLSAGTSWSVVYNGRKSSGTLLPYGTYRAEVVIGSVVALSRTFVSSSSQVGSPTAAWAPSSVFPVRDGYRDSSRLGITTNVPATVSVVIKTSSGKTVWSKSLSRRLTSGVTWTGRTSTGSIVPAGTYTARITVKGDEGVARTASRTIAVSAKKVTAVSFSGVITAVNAYDFTLVGDYEPQSDGSIGLWSSPYLGDTIHAFSMDLPSSFENRYSNLKVYGCGESSSYTGTAGLLRSDSGWNSDYGGWLLGSDSACYGGSWDPALLNGRRLYTIVGNAAADTTYYWLDGFKVTGTRYVLK